MVPVSSSAQLVLVPWLLGWPPAADRTGFAAALHAGSCLGIVAVTRPWRAGPRTLAMVAATSLPAAVAGLLAADRVEARLGRPPQIAALLAVAGLALLAADRAPTTRPAVGPKQAAVAALAQVSALMPGVSRSGATLTALRLLGVERGAAQRFSLLMSLPVTAGAAGLTLARADRNALLAARPALAVGAATSLLAGAAAAAVQQSRPGRPATWPALYRLVTAGVVARRLLRKDPL